MTSGSELVLRAGKADDLPAINRVIEAAVLGWNLPERVKRLALSSYFYQQHDLDHIDLWVIETDEDIVAVAALEPAGPRELPPGKQGLLLHGLYVHPDYQHRGIGSRLLATAEQQAREQGLDGLLVRAQSGAGEFFSASGMQRLSSEDNREYQNRYWKAVS